MKSNEIIIQLFCCTILISLITAIETKQFRHHFFFTLLLLIVFLLDSNMTYMIATMHLIGNFLTDFLKKIFTKLYWIITSSHMIVIIT